MREIKFRAKYKLGSIPVLGQYLRNEGEWKYGELRMRKVTPCIYDEENRTYPIDKGTIGQFTGLLDKNGKEIYEDDFVKSNCNFHGLVRWHKNGYFYIGENPDKVIESDFTPLGEMLNFASFEVIGNVYDNPELLK